MAPLLLIVSAALLICTAILVSTDCPFTFALGAIGLTASVIAANSLLYMIMTGITI